MASEWKAYGAGLSDGTVLLLCGPDSLGVAAKPGPHLAEVSWERLRPLLRAVGLDLCTAAEREVLKACAELDLRPNTKGSYTYYGGHRDVHQAELSRRAAEKA